MQTESFETLYIICRKDAQSMRDYPGKVAAQASHATNLFIKTAKEENVDISGWENQTEQGFGTCIVLETYDWAKTIQHIKLFDALYYVTGIVTDPTYPLMDGSVLHTLPFDTCAFVYTPDRQDDNVKLLLAGYSLYV